MSKKSLLLEIIESIEDTHDWCKHDSEPNLYLGPNELELIYTGEHHVEVKGKSTSIMLGFENRYQIDRLYRALKGLKPTREHMREQAIRWELKYDG